MKDLVPYMYKYFLGRFGQFMVMVGLVTFMKKIGSSLNVGKLFCFLHYSERKTLKLQNYIIFAFLHVSYFNSQKS